MYRQPMHSMQEHDKKGRELAYYPTMTRNARGTTHLVALLNTWSSSARIIMTVWN
jgi:hypothetical protein